MSKNRIPTESIVERVARLESSYSFALGNLGRNDQYRIFQELTAARTELAETVVSLSMGVEL